MALTLCSECKTQISERAPTCPKCGAPQALPVQGRKQRKTHPVTWVVFFALVGFLGWKEYQSVHESSLPTLPLKAEYRKALLGPGFVVQLQNTSTAAIPVVASLQHSSVNDLRRFDLYVPPGGSVEIGRLQGWIGEPGDRITLENSNYQTWSGSIP
jgi:hypothetical protein